jgi:pyruvate ferredoxin oxidoreductase delta subunit
MLNDDQKQAIKRATVKRTMKIKRSQKPDFSDRPNWEDVPEGAIVTKAGNSKEYITGNWVPKKLNFNKDTCINCGLCWPVCPDDAIVLDENGNMKGVDINHCKDCGLCVEACPTKPNKSLYFEDEEPKEI